MIFRPALSDTAFEYLTTQLHKRSQRANKRHTSWSGTSFERVEPRNSGKGISQSLENFLCPAEGYLSSEYYTTNRKIRPDSFVDLRGWAEDDYIAFGYPGQNPEDYIPGYTTWTLETQEKTTHTLILPTSKILDCLLEIGQYWHISFSNIYRPRTKKEIQSATLEAIGIGYLNHPLLPKPNKIPPESIEN